jgi:hypothetical protein
MKHLLILLLAASAHAQLLPVTPAERALSDIDRAAAASRYYGELYAQSLSTLHAKIFGLDDATLKSVLERLGDAQSEQLLTLYVSSATGINQILAAGGSSVRAPETRTREWVWSGDTVTITPLPEPVAAP